MIRFRLPTAPSRSQAIPMQQSRRLPSAPIFASWAKKPSLPAPLLSMPRQSLLRILPTSQTIAYRRYAMPFNGITRNFSVTSTGGILGNRFDQCQLRRSERYRVNTSRSYWSRRPQKKPPAPNILKSFFTKFDIDQNMKALRDLHVYVRNHLSLDIWTINLLLVTFVAGPTIFNAMKNSPLTEDDYMFSIPVDDPVEHSVRILMELNNGDESTTSTIDQDGLSSHNVGTKIISPEEDAKRILNDLLASENLRTTASRIASGVIQSPHFQNACKILVHNIWNDLVSDPETNSQLVSLLHSVLQSETIYLAVKELLIKLINDEQVYGELTKLIVQLGEEREVLDATQRLLTESTHKTLNDPDVLDHSMEFATEVVGDDVVQRTGGEALRNSFGYAVQPSGGAMFLGLGTTLVAGAIYFYYLGNGRVDKPSSSVDSFSSANGKSWMDQNVISTPAVSNSHLISTSVQSTRRVIFNILVFPLVILRSISNGINTILSSPQHALSYASEKLRHCLDRLTNLPEELRSNITSFCAQLIMSVKNCTSSFCTIVTVKAGTLQSCLDPLSKDSMDYIMFISKTTKGALVHVVSVIRHCAKLGIEKLLSFSSLVQIRLINLMQNCAIYWSACYRFFASVINERWGKTHKPLG